MSELVLGTAQFGLNYGVTNAQGQVARDTVRAMLDTAQRLGIAWLDTAHAYGNAETVLGACLGPQHRFRICTKVGAGLAGTNDMAGELRRQFDISLERLCGRHIDLLLLHDASLLNTAQCGTVLNWLQQIKQEGVVGAWGVSLYDGTQVRQLLAQCRPDWVQLPCNVLDQRLFADGTLLELQAAGVRIQARSALLQGLLLADPDVLPEAFAALRTPLRRVRTFGLEHGATPLQLALGFLCAQPSIEQVVIGAVSPAQIEEISAAQVHASHSTIAASAWRDLACENQDVLDPRRWPSDVKVAA